LGIGRATFVGNSLGGLIALRLALSEPARVTALVLVDSAGLGSAVNPAFTSVNIPLLGEAAMPSASGTVRSPSSPTAATCPTSSAPIASWELSTGSSSSGCSVNRWRPEESPRLRG
jgi:pimeloyl-ACP methyl ester carboxylesterase